MAWDNIEPADDLSGVLLVSCVVLRFPRYKDVRTPHQIEYKLGSTWHGNLQTYSRCHGARVLRGITESRVGISIRLGPSRDHLEWVS